MNSLREWTKKTLIKSSDERTESKATFFIYTHLHENFLQAVRLSCRNTEAKKEDDGKMNVVAEIAEIHTQSYHVMMLNLAFLIERE
jgi:hypothetical protein